MDLLWYWLVGLLLTIAAVGCIYGYAAYQMKRSENHKDG